MFKWDTISWIAAAILITGILLGVIVHQLFLTMLVASYVLRPALIAFGMGRRNADERQVLIQFRSGNIALVILIAAIVVFIVKETMEGKPADNYVFLLAVALAAKALVGLLMIRDYRAAGVRITMFIGLLYLLFVSLEGGFSLGTLVEGAPALLILVVGVVGIRRPMISAIALAILGLATAILFGVPGGFTEKRIYVSLLLSVPLLIAAFCFYKGSKSESPRGIWAVKH